MNDRIVVVGSLNADLIFNISRFPAPGETIQSTSLKIYSGGKGANQAYAAARLGARVSLVGRVGNDERSHWLKESLSSGGVDVTHVQHDSHQPCGTAVILVDEGGQNQIILDSGANHQLSPDELERSRTLIEEAGILLLQFEIPMDTVLSAARMAKRSGVPIMLDPAPAQKTPSELLALADYVTPNETELNFLTDSALDLPLSRAEAAAKARLLQSQGASKVLIKMGEQGALLVNKDDEHYWPPVKVKAVDTTAAGDVFNAAFAVALVSGKSEWEAGSFAAAAAACSVTRQGAQQSMPTLDEVEKSARKISR